MWGNKMKIESIRISNDGYVNCTSRFYSAHDILDSRSFYSFFPGINKLIGEIDSGNWAVSYLLSMYKHRPQDFILFEQPNVFVNNELISLTDMSEFSCYMDESYPLFSDSVPIKEHIIRGLNHSKLNLSYDDIMNLFDVGSDESFRFERPLKSVGNTIIRAMAAIGVSYDKELFCFPWLSNMRFEGYHGNMTITLKILENLGKTVIVPVGSPS